jgi:hypothetical protein
MQLSYAEFEAVLRQDLMSFIERSFYELNPQTRFSRSPHIEVTASKLEACRQDRLRRLIVNQPPRSLKSHAVSVAFPAWVLGHNPAKKLAREWPDLEISKRHGFIRNVLRRVVIGQTKIWIEFNPTRLAEALLERKLGSNVVASEPERDIIKVAADFKPLRRGGELCLMRPKNSSSEGTPNASLVKAVAYARDWYEKIVAGEIGTIVELAQKTGVGSTYAKRILRCAILSPEIVESILSGDHRPNLMLQDLPRTIPLDWRKQIGIMGRI